MTAIAMDIIKNQAIKKKITLAEFFFSVTLTTNSSFSNVLFLIPIFFSLFFSSLSSSLAANKRDNKYYNKNLFVKFLTILPKSIISTHKKTFIKTADLAYFNRFKKHSKVWDYKT